ncbi:MAG: hypothetical protein ABEH77_04515 [Halobacteriaceae archaeon]
MARASDRSFSTVGSRLLDARDVADAGRESVGEDETAFYAVARHNGYEDDDPVVRVVYVREDGRRAVERTVEGREIDGEVALVGEFPAVVGASPDAGERVELARQETYARQVTRLYG